MASLIGLAVASGAWLFGRGILSFAFSPAYARHADALVVVLLASGIGHVAGVLKGATDASRRYAVQLPIYAASASIAIVAACVLVPTWGIMGAAWCVVISKAGIALGYVVVVWQQKLVHVAPAFTLSVEGDAL